MTGDVGVFRGPEPYTVADDPATAPQVVIHPGQRCTTLDGEDLKPEMELGARSWGNSPHGSTVMICGTYQMPGELGERLLHHHPEQPWTVASLAAATGVSRAAFARRFTELVGEPPMAYLTGWRLALAADLLNAPAATVGAVARQVGYGSGFALSTAFKRVRGVSPKAHRAGTPVG